MKLTIEIDVHMPQADSDIVQKEIIDTYCYEVCNFLTGPSAEGMVIQPTIHGDRVTMKVLLKEAQIREVPDYIWGCSVHN